MRPPLPGRRAHRKAELLAFRFERNELTSRIELEKPPRSGFSFDPELVSCWQILLQKSFYTSGQNFCGLYVSFSRKVRRDLVV